MKKVVLLVVAVIAIVVIAVIAHKVQTTEKSSGDQIEIKMGSFEKAPPSGKNFKLNDINITFDDEKTNAKPVKVEAK